MSKTIMSKKGQVVIPKDAREELNLSPGVVLRVEVEKGKVILEPYKKLPEKAFVHAGSKITEPILREAKASGDKTQRLLQELGINCHESP